ncbi:MAG: hypothetical protein R2705_10070 [Ilumatobacteraceae bacterium]
MTNRRLVSSSLAAVALVVASCATSNGASPPQQVTLDNVGVLPAQVPLTAATSLDNPVAETGVVSAGGSTRDSVEDVRVFMEGDSVLRGLTIGSPDALDLFVASLGWDLTVDARDGRFTDEGVRMIKSRASEVHEVLVTMLGNNYDGDPKRYAEDLTSLLLDYPDVKLFVMFTVPEFESEQREVNDVLRGLAAIDDRIVLVDWERISRTYDGVLGSDGLHPTEYGRLVLAQAIGLALGRAPGSIRASPCPGSVTATYRTGRRPTRARTRPRRRRRRPRPAALRRPRPRAGARPARPRPSPRPRRPPSRAPRRPPRRRRPRARRRPTSPRRPTDRRPPRLGHHLDSGRLLDDLLDDHDRAVHHHHHDHGPDDAHHHLGALRSAVVTGPGSRPNRPGFERR